MAYVRVRIPVHEGAVRLAVSQCKIRQERETSADRAIAEGLGSRLVGLGMRVKGGGGCLQTFARQRFVSKTSFTTFTVLDDRFRANTTSTP